MATLETIISTFVELQTQLVRELKRGLGQQDWRDLIGVPRRGHVDVNGTLWRYQVHGAGVRFFSDHAIVDMNRRMDGDPSAFDAGRIAEYLESTNENPVSWRGKLVEFNYETGGAILREMHATGALIRIGTPSDGELYTLPPTVK